jgi:outer membrane biosynthesis protein TonB
MFDTVGKNNDEEATKRSLASLLITTVLLGAGAAFFVGYGAMKVVETVQAVQTSDDMVEVILEDPGMDEAPPPPPPPPPPPAAADDAEEEDEDEDEEPTNETDEMVEEVKELKEEVKTEIKSVERPKGVKDGVEGGVEGGVVGGVKDGVKDGVVGGQLDGGGIRMFHHSELEVKARKLPRYPEAAEAMNLGDQRCKVRVKIDEKGIPFEARVEGCPKVFHDEAREAILKWKWYPPKNGKTKVKAQTTIAVMFKSR